MDRLSDAAAASWDRQPDRDASCPSHGPYPSRNLFRNVWSRCPECEAAKEAAERAEQAAAAAREADARHQRMLGDAAIPLRFIGRSFGNFRAETDAQRHALTVARDFAEQFADNRRKGRGLIFAGLMGTGKSHLATSILQALLPAHQVRYATCLDMIRAVRDTWRRDSEKTETQVLAYLRDLDLLVIDEVGVQYGTDGEQTILFDVLDRRYREVRPTIILTNQDKAGLKTFVGERTYDRLTETCRWVPFDWSSHRPQARKESQQ